MTGSSSKAQRLQQIEAFLLAHPEGLTQAGIARRLGVHRATVGRYIPDLPGHVYIDEEDGNRWKLDRAGLLVNVRLNLHESMAFHLAARLMTTRSDKQNPHAASALRKLGLALEKLAPRVSHHLQRSADEIDDAARHHDPVFLGVLEKLTLAWAEEHKVRLWHRHQPSGNVYEYLFSPYFIEPYAVGQTTHVFGWREPPEGLRTFKVERIERIELTRERYEIPPEFDPSDLLADAWGIWYTEKEPIPVLLRFHPRVAQRVSETRWHASQELELQPDGSLIFRVLIAEPQEMMPWIRGWGADCEVLEPDNLRAALAQESARMAALYAPGVVGG